MRHPNKMTTWTVKMYKFAVLLYENSNNRWQKMSYTKCYPIQDKLKHVEIVELFPILKTAEKSSNASYANK